MTSDTIIAPSRARRVACYISSPDAVLTVSFGTPAVTGGTSNVGFLIGGGGASNSRALPVRFAYDDLGESLYQDIHAIATGAPATAWVLDVFEADELGPEHYAKQLPQLWDARVPRAVAL